VHDISDGERRGASLRLGLSLGVVVAYLSFSAARAAVNSCVLAVGSNGAGYALGCLAVGAVAGIGMGASLFLTGQLARRHRWLLALVVGGATSLVAGAGAYFLHYAIASCVG
jgi:hypothetical protein